MRDKRAKIRPKGSFQVGSVDKVAVTRYQRTATEAERIQKQIQKQQGVGLATFGFTSFHDTSLECRSEEVRQVIYLHFVTYPI